MSDVTSPRGFTHDGEMLPATRRALAMFAGRRARLRIGRGLLLGTATLLAGMLIVAAVDHFFVLSVLWRSVLSLLGYALSAVTAYVTGLRHVGSRDWTSAARGIEETSPVMRNRLLAALELDQPESANGSPEFRRRLQESLNYDLSQFDVRGLLPWQLIKSAMVGVAAVTVVVTLLLSIPSLQMSRRLARAFLPIVPIERASVTRITLLRPSPVSQVVAEGDLVAVVAKIERLRGTDVTLHWRTPDGRSGETPMTPRIPDELPDELPDESGESAAIAATTTRDGLRFAANLSVDSVAMEYRVTAGDAETLWATLTPLPRPRVVAFEKRIVYPEYAQLPDDIVTDDVGDLVALMGSTAEVTVRFDGPVTEATVHFASDQSGVMMKPIAGDAAAWRMTVPIKTSGSYRVDGISADSGLNNPFNARYPIDPQLDRAPLAMFFPAPEKTQIVSPAAVLAMSGRVVDDLPIDYVIQQVIRDGEGVREIRHAVDPPAREATVTWDWDITRWDGGPGETNPVTRGTRLRTRLVAVDRAGRRGESEWIDFLIADLQFDADRHDDLRTMRRLIARVTDWWQTLDTLAEQTTIWTGVDVDDESDRDTRQSLDALRESWAAIRGGPSDDVADMADVNDMDGGTLLDRLRATTDSVQSDHWAMLDDFATAALAIPDWSDRRDGKIGKDIRRLAERAEEFARCLLAVELAVAIRGDLVAIEANSRRLASPESGIPVIRLPGQAELLAEQFRQVSGLVSEWEDGLPESTVRHHQQIHRFVDDVVERIERETDRLRQSQDVNPQVPFLNALASLADQVRSQRTHAILDGQSFNGITVAVRDWTADSGLLAAEIRQALGGRPGPDRNADAAILVDRITATEMIEQSRTDLDVRSTADLALIRRVIEHVSTRDAEPTADISGDVFATISSAARTLLSGAIQRRAADQLRDLASVERYSRNEDDLVVRQGMRLEHFHVATDAPLNQLRSAGVPPGVIDRLHQTRYNEDYSRARDLTTVRRWDAREIVRADNEIERLAHTHAEWWPAIEPILQRERQVLWSLLPSLAETARDAADAVARAAETSEQESAPEKDAAEETMKSKVAATAEQLVDRANNADLTEAADVQAARDADLALAAINRQLRQDDRDALEATLRATAEHFENLDADRDADQSRDALRRAAQDADPVLQASAQSAQSAANSAEQTPEAWMRQLERELRRNEPMQDELQDLASDIANAAEQTVRQAADKEEQLRQSLENADASFNERKRKLRDELMSLRVRARGIEQAWVAAAQSAGGWANEPQLAEQIRQARQTLQEATDQLDPMQSDDTLLEQIRDVASKMRQSVDQTVQTLDAVSEAAAEAQDDEIHNESRKRDQAARQLQSTQDRTQNQWVNTLKQDAQQWQQRSQQAGQRIRQSQNEQRQATDQLRQAQQQLKKHADEEWAQNQVRDAETRLAAADRGVAATKQQRENAEAASKQADERFKVAQKTKTEPLDAKNPAAQWMNRASETAQAELSQLAEQLDRIGQAAQFDDDLELDSRKAAELAAAQNQTMRAVSEAAENLRRAARHETRLGENDSAKKLDAAAESLAETVDQTMDQARDSLQSSSENAASASQAGRELGQAAAQLRDQAERIAGLAGEMSPADESQSAPSPAGDSDKPSRAQQLARSLDELDRETLGQPPRANSPPDEDGSGGDGPGGDGPGEDGPPTAGQASPTLARAAENAVRQAAAKRDQQLQQLARAGQPESADATTPGTDPSTPSQDATPASQSGDNASMPSGGLIDADGWLRHDGDWGELRDRETDDVIQDRRPNVPPAYQSAVEAYFRAIAAESAKAERSPQGAER